MSLRIASSVGAAMLLCAVLPAGAADTTIAMRGDDGPYFARAYAVILVGETVTWRNDTEEPHTVASYPDAPREFQSHPGFDPARGCDDQNILTQEDCMDPGEAFDFTFEQAGTYKFYCQVHADPSADPDRRVSPSEQPCGMCGVISVVAKDPKPKPKIDRKSETPTAGPTRKATSTRRARASASPSPSPSETTLDLARAAGRGGGGSGGRLTMALLAIVALGGAGYYTWRRFLGGSTSV